MTKPSTITSSPRGLEGLIGERPVDRYRLAMVPRLEATRAAHATMFPLQQMDNPEAIVMGVAVMFNALCRRCALSPEALYEMAARVIDAPPEGDHVTDDSLVALQTFVAAKLAAYEGVVIS